MPSLPIPTRHRVQLAALGLSLLLLSSAAPLWAAGPGQTAGGITLSAEGGFDSYYKDGLWTPVRITVGNDGSDLEGVLRVTSPRADGTEAVFTRAVQLPTQSRREFFFYTAPEGFVRTLTVTLTRDSQKMAEATVRLAQATSSDLIYGILAASPSVFNQLADVDPITGQGWVAQLAVSDLPPVGQAWQSLDVLIVSDTDTGALSPEQRAALAGWVAGGGRLIVAGGPSWQKTAAGLLDLLPLVPTGAQTIDDLSGLSSLAVAAAPAGSAVAAVGRLTGDAVVVASAEDVPLVVVRRSGYGQVIYLAADPAFEPLRSWIDFAAFFRGLMAMPLERPSWAGGFRTNWSAANDAVNAIPGLDLPSTFQICGFLALYLIIVGPLNYLILKRLNRRELAWLTIPATVAVFSLGAYLFGYQLRGSTATLHRLAVVQVWPDSDQAQVDAVIGLLSPRRSTYSLEFDRAYLVKPLPYQPSVSAVEQADVSRVSNLRAEIGQVQSFIAQGQIAAPHFESDLTLTNAAGVMVLKGSVSNLSGLNLSQAVLLAPGSVQALGEFAPGDTEQINLLLASGRATPSQFNNAAPVLPPAPGAGKPATYYPYGGYDTTIDDILGGTNYYENKAAFRKYSLLQAAVNSGNGGGRGGGVYLAGWVDSSPLNASITDRPFTTLDQTLYILALHPVVDLGQGVATLPPAAMTWTVTDPGTAGNPSPYDFYVYGGYSYALRFQPAQLTSFRSVRSLSLRLTSYSLTGPVPMQVSLWDLTENTWVAQPGLTWGTHSISAPARYVSPTGEIQVRVDNPASAAQANIETLDFTLVVEE